MIQVVNVKSNQEEYIKQKFLSCKCSEYATIKWIIKNKNTDGIGNKICEYVACKHWNYNQMSHSFRHDDPQGPTERTPLTQMINDFFLTTL